MNIPFTKSHGARNDFLLTWRGGLPAELADSPDRLTELAIAICERHTGVGADGWILISPAASVADESHAAIELWNSDGSRSEISGNGTRCAAAFLIAEGRAGEQIRIATGAGQKSLRLLDRSGNRFQLEMNMGQAVIEGPDDTLVPGRKAMILNVGNPQCAVFCQNFNLDWRQLGAELERHPRFPNRTNVSFVRVMDDHTIDVRFFERGAGETMSSGTGSTGAAAASIALGLVSSPVHVLTPAGPLEIQQQDGELLLAGPAELTSSGEFYFNGN